MGLQVVTVVGVLTLLLSICDCCDGGKTPSGLYTDDGHGRNVLSTKFSRKEVREISDDILGIMGFVHRPHPHLASSSSPASQFLLQVYRSVAGGEEADGVDLSGEGRWGRSKARPDNLTWSEFNVDKKEVEAIRSADAIISFANRGHRFSDRLRGHEEEKQFWFDVSEVSPRDLVLGVELRIWKGRDAGRKGWEGQEPLTSDVLRIGVHQVIPGKIEGSFEERELDEIVAAKWEQGWLRLNVTKAFRSWIADPGSNYGLLLSTKRADTGGEIGMEKTGLATMFDIDEHQPFLVSFLNSAAEPAHARPPRPRRVIRSPGGSGGKKGRKSKKGRQMEFSELLDRPRSCQMGMLYVNFEDLGWKDWVIAPDGFIAYYCTGECSFPLTASMNATNHAIVSTLVHTYYPSEYPKPSCAPVKLGSISMLYYDDNSNVTVKKYKDMVIKSCGCK